MKMKKMKMKILIQNDVSKFGMCGMKMLSDSVKNIQFGEWPERLKIRDVEGNELGECSICMYNMKDIILQPCGHCCMCKMCYDKMQDIHLKCPICRRSVNSYGTVYSYAVKNLEIHQSVQFESYNILSLLSNLKLLS
jgi:hypothetical protein